MGFFLKVITPLVKTAIIYLVPDIMKYLTKKLSELIRKKTGEKL